MQCLIKINLLSTGMLALAKFSSFISCFPVAAYNLFIDEKKLSLSLPSLWIALRRTEIISNPIMAKIFQYWLHSGCFVTSHKRIELYDTNNTPVLELPGFRGYKDRNFFIIKN